MKALYVTSEIFPLNKTGGLGDVSAFLPPALKNAGVDIRIFIPGFPEVLDGVNQLKPVLELENIFTIKKATVFKGYLKKTGLPVYVLKAPEFFTRFGNPYIDSSGHEWGDNYLRFALFSYIGAAFSTGITSDNFIPDVIHCNDWHTGLLPAYLKMFKEDKDFKDKINTAAIYTIHNLMYQGVYDADYFKDLAFPEKYLSPDGIEFYGNISFMKSGIYFADKITTVSPTYAEEIQTEQFGCGYEGLLNLKKDYLTGILNGVDYDVWNPETDKHIDTNYSVLNIPHKEKNKIDLMKTVGLDNQSKKPLLGFIGRITEQKGLDLLLEVIPDIVNLEGQLIILGMGDKKLEAKIKEKAEEFSEYIKFINEKNEKLAHKIIAGSDIILIPSKFEPCGLIQLYAFKYGTIPLAARTGGLADTIIDANLQTVLNKTANGFLFDFPLGSDLKNTISKAFTVYKDQKMWLTMQKRAMKQNFSWEKAANEYLDLYNTQLNLEV